MKNRSLVLAGVIAFSVALGVIAGYQLASIQALAVALGVGIGTTIGVSASWLLLRSQLRHADEHDTEMTTIIMPQQEAEKLIRMLNTRQQADPGAFPMVADRERRFTAVGGASFDEEDIP